MHCSVTAPLGIAHAAAAAAAAGRVSSRHHAAPPPLLLPPCRALPPKRRKLFRKKKPAEQQPKQLSDDELIRQLNSSHLWLPDADDTFGLDDVAAHVESKNQAQVLDLSNKQGSSRKGAAAAAAAAAADPQALSDIDPASGQPLPEWISDLQQAGFDVMSRDGQVYLQRGNITPQQQQQQQQQQQPQRAPASQPRRQSAAAAAAPQQPDPSTAGVLQVSDKSLSVRAEFDAAVWQEHIQSGQHSSSSSSSSSPEGGSSSDASDLDAAAAAAGAAWYAAAGPPAGSSSSASPAADNSNTTSSSSGSSTGSTGSTPGTDSRRPVMSAASIQRSLLGFRHPQRLLSLLQRVFPAWAANGAWLVSQTAVGVVAAPTPAEAAAALKGLALAARRARLNTVQLQSLAREPLVSGLVEALRLTPPRCEGLPHQPPDLSRRLWSIAKTYWMQAGATTAAAAQQQLLAGALAAQGRHGQQMLGRAGAEGGSALGPLLAQLQARGGAVSKQQLAAAQALVSAKGEDQLRRSAVVSALWGMSVIGGAMFFQTEMSALCQIAQAKFSRWSPSPAELSDVLWALAHTRHWTPLLTQLDSCLVAAGAPQACAAAEAVSSVWAFAVLGHTPTLLLGQLDKHGWTVKPDASSRSSSSSSRSSNDQPKQQQQQQGAAADCNSGGGGGSALASLRDSQLCTLAWSLACLQQVDGALFRGVWGEVCRRGPGLCADTRQAVQLAQSALAVTLEGSYQPDELCPGPGTEQLLAAAASAFAAQGAALQAQKAHSSYQRSIAGTLSRLRVMHVLEDTSSGYAVDITVPSMRLAIEADGPSHFSRTPGPSGRWGLQVGATAMKRRHLTRLGWTVVNVPYSDWDRQADEQQRVAYLKQQIAAAKKPAAAAAAAAAAGPSS